MNIKRCPTCGHTKLVQSPKTTQQIVDELKQKLMDSFEQDQEPTNDK